MSDGNFEDQLSEAARRMRMHQHMESQFAALGRFIQNFELMIDGIRRSISFLHWGKSAHPELVSIMLHHHSMTARPLLDIFRASYEVSLDNITDSSYFKDRDVMRSILRHITKKCDGLIEVRNTLIHGTWCIGWYPIGEENFDEFHVNKFKVKSEGLKLVPTPTTLGELVDLSNACNDISRLMFLFPTAFEACATKNKDIEDFLPSKIYEEVDGRWMRKTRV